MDSGSFYTCKQTEGFQQKNLKLLYQYQDSCMFHCQDPKCNGILSKWIPHTKEEALEHVYNGIFFCLWDFVHIYVFSILQDLEQAQRNGESHGPFFH